jgi:hypothetical protein
VRLTAEVRVPAAVGLKVTLIVQLAPVATLDPQLLAREKSPASPPERTTLVTLRAAVPVLVRVIVLAALVVATVWLPNVIPVGERVTVGPFAIAVPDNATA